MAPSMVEVNRTLMKSTPELWKVVDGRELIGRLSAELFGSRMIEVVEREPSRRLAWRVYATPGARVELALAEKDWGTRVAIRVEGGEEEFARAVLVRLLDELGSDQRRPVAGPDWGSGEGVAAGQDGKGAAGGTASNGGGPQARDLDELSDLIVRHACELIQRAVRAAEDRLAEAEEWLCSEAEDAEFAARERIEEAQRRLSGRERERELGLVQQGRNKRIETAEHRLAKRAAEIFARFEREVGRLQERARRVVAAAASKEVGRRVERSVEPALREIEDRLTATVRGGVSDRMAAPPETAAPIASWDSAGSGEQGPDRG